MNKLISNPRRDFLKLGSATAVSAAFISTNVKAQSASIIDKPPEKIKLAPSYINLSAEAIIALSAIELSNAIKARKVSCKNVMTAYLDRIELLNPIYNAITSLRDRDILLSEAHQCDDELNQGHYRGWMHGFPHAIKDLSAAKGLPLTFGFVPMKNNIADYDTLFTARIKKAGAIIIGKTNVPEFGLGSQSYNRIFGTTLNAYDKTKVAGGSSGGASVALALRMIPVADGSDMMGSLRNPAAFNNIIGFRPSVGRVPNSPSKELFVQQLGYAGPMGRTVTEVAKLLSTMAGFDDSAPLSISENPNKFDVDLTSNVKGKKIAWLGNYNGYLPMEDGVLALCEKALLGFKGIGCKVEPATVDFSMEKLWQTWLTHRHWLVSNGSTDLYENPIMRKEMKPELIWEIEGGLHLTAKQVYQASLDRSAWYSALNALLDKYDFLVLPSAQVFAFDAKTHWPKTIGNKKMDTYHRWMEVVIGPTLSGLPVINVPAGFNDQGLAMGLQVIGKKNKDLDVLKIAYAYEQATRWNLDYPPKVSL